MVNTGVFPVPPPKGGGTEYRLYNLANALGDLGCEVHFVTGVADGASFNKKVFVHRINSASDLFNLGFFGWTLSHLIGGIHAFEGAVRNMDGNDFDLVHVHGRFSSFLLAKTMGKFPLVYTVHNPGPWLCAYEGFFERIVRTFAYYWIDIGACRKARQIIAVGTPIRDELVLRWKIPRDKITVVHSGVDTDIFTPGHHGDYIKQRYGINGDYVLFVGQLTRRKGAQFLLRAMRDVDMKCVIVGDGPELSSLIALTDRMNLTKKVTFTGSVPFYDLTKLYANAQFLVLPSTAEGHPLTILEAMSCRLPVIASDVGAVKESILNGYNGFLVKSHNVKQLKEKILLLNDDKQLRRKMGKNARRFVEENFSWKSIAEKVLEVYMRVASNGI